MNSSQQPFLTMPSGCPSELDSLGQFMDDDVVLGCECADPALQIDGWGEHAPQPLQERN